MTAKLLDLGTQLLQRGRTPVNDTTILPVNEVPMVLTLAQLRSNPDNPRTRLNPKYDDIKSSIKYRGLDSVPKVTKNPESNEDVYIISDGGNTRLEILNELWLETQDEKFNHIQCIFKPWPGRLKCVIGHLAENETRGDLSFIEKAFGIEKAKNLYQEQLGKSVSQSELATFLKVEGYPISQPNISVMEYTIKYLYPSIPRLLDSGIGRPLITQLISLRNAAESGWKKFLSATSIDISQSFNEVFHKVYQPFDDPDIFEFDVVKDELIFALLKAMPSPDITYDSWQIELDPKEQARRKLFGETNNNESEPEIEGKASTPKPSNMNKTESTLPPHPTSANYIAIPERNDKESDTSILNSCQDEEQLDFVLPFMEDLSTSEPESAGETELTSADIIEQDSIARLPVTFASTGLEPVTDIWSISTLQDDTDHLKNIAYRLAFEIVEASECERYLEEDPSQKGIGYSIKLPERNDIFPLSLLSAFCNDKAYVIADYISPYLTGDNYSEPLFDDVLLVKFFRLIRIIRRLRELQRKETNHG